MKKNVIWNTFGSVFYCVCQWLITVVVNHMSSYDMVGILSLAMTASSSFSAISLFSMRNFQVSDIQGEYSTDEYVGSRILTCIIAFVCCAAASCFGNSWYQILCIDAFMLVRVAEAWVDVMHGIDQKHNRYDYIGKSYILRGILTIGVLPAMLSLTGNLLLALVLMACANLAAAVLYDWRKTGGLERMVPVLFQKKVFRLLCTCAPIVVFTFLLSLENYIPKKVLEYQYGNAQLGIYSLIANVAVVVQVFASVAFNPFLPGFTQVYYTGDAGKFSGLMHRLYLVLIGLCVIVNIGAILLGRLGLQILYGEDILNYYDLFLPIVWCTILTAVIWILSAILIAMRKIKWLIAGMAVDFALCLVIVFPLVERYGKNGVSIVQITVMGLYVLFMVLVCEIHMYHKKRKETKDEKTNHYTCLQ